MPSNRSLHVSEQAALERSEHWLRHDSPGPEKESLLGFSKRIGLLEILGNTNNNHQIVIL